MNQSLQSIGVILVNYRDAQDTCDCIDSLFKSDYKKIQIYVVDNASNDESIRIFEEKYHDKICLISLPDNVGFGNANNIGIEHAFENGDDAVLILNNDTIVDKKMINILKQNITDNEIAVPLMLYHDDPSLIWYAGGRFDRFGIPRHIDYRNDISKVDLRQCYVDFATGCCFLMTRNVYERVGGFDGNYFLYWEDADLSIRLQQHDVKIKFCPDAVLWHKVSSSTGGEASPISYYYGTRNRLYAISKFHLGFLTKLWAYLSLIRGCISKKPQYEFVKKAYIDYKNGSFGKMK